MKKWLEGSGPEDFHVETLGTRQIPSPVSGRNFIEDSRRVSFLVDVEEIIGIVKDGGELPSYESGGPRKLIYHDPATCRAAIVTCGGLCPGLNDVIKSIVHVLNFEYGISDILGIRYGYAGFIPSLGHAPMPLTVEGVDHIHETGGTILGTSRGKQDSGQIVDFLIENRINLLFCIGGDGTLRGASSIAKEALKRETGISVVGIPKTIDNDLLFIDRSFGFESSIYATFDILTQAHIEAKGAFRGISIVRLMGRDSGYIAGAATLANSVVNFCLVPEVPFTLDGDHGLLKALERRFDESNHAVIVVAEGAGQDLFEGLPEERDRSGNILKHNIGTLLKGSITAHFKGTGQPVTVRYFNPSYSIRSGPARGTDAIYCHVLADTAVHAAMAGKTNVLAGRWGGRPTNVPIPIATKNRRKLDIDGPEWKAVLSLTRQATYFEGC